MAVAKVFEDGFGRRPFLRALEGGCANLGHVEDDESNLIYMRARYYDPTSGRFLSEDPDRRDANWYIYCKCQPLALADASGRDGVSFGDLFTIIQSIAKKLGIDLPKWFKPSEELVECITAGVVALSRANFWIEAGSATADLSMALFGLSPLAGGIALAVGCVEGVYGLTYLAVAAVTFDEAADELELLVDSLQ